MVGTERSTMNLSTSELPRQTDQRRVAACVRACKGISTELLESGILLKLVAACVHLRDSPRIREVLEELALGRLREDDRTARPDWIRRAKPSRPSAVQPPGPPGRPGRASLIPDAP